MIIVVVIVVDGGGLYSTDLQTSSICSGTHHAGEVSGNDFNASCLRADRILESWETSDRCNDERGAGRNDLLPQCSPEGGVACIEPAIHDDSFDQFQPSSDGGAFPASVWRKHQKS